MSGRTMALKYNQEESSIYQLCGGYPQGSKIGQDCYLGSSDDAALHIEKDDRFRYIDDLQILELVMLTGILRDYDMYMHVASDVPLDYQFLDSTHTQMQSHLDQLSVWSDTNLTKLNPAKCSYMILSRARQILLQDCVLEEQRSIKSRPLKYWDVGSTKMLESGQPIPRS